ncbi:hypothetical protein HYH02_012151 [Chlamydomonas schloesseri]|uniref:RanBP-type and C3HC4-type zinc finger-containing protein 1 n=1 Tax=Chlamydomonas schloesseri TaxID=2026947 RepID=A0A835T9Q7_9CHLO|nr:hypothetical protein HYH02_012151 [Chlamydomonas schloesseri]|eukprot:KAG2434955.1 hypothetical protein HYH02_012151 [Chlamydomonas schloesseri]
MGDVTAEIESRIYELGKTLRCPICLSIMDQPARLPCLHYFCWGCITHNVKPRGEVICPSCRDRSNRRDIQEDSLLATFARRYGQIEAALGKTLHLSQLPPLEPLGPLMALPAMGAADGEAGAVDATGTDMAEGRKGKQRKRGEQQLLQRKEAAQAQAQDSGIDEKQQPEEQRKNGASAEQEQQEKKATKVATSQAPRCEAKRAKATAGTGRAAGRQGAKGRSVAVPDRDQAGEPPAQPELQQALKSATAATTARVEATAPATGGRLFGFLDPTGEDRSPEDTRTTALTCEHRGHGEAPGSVHNGRGAAAAGGRGQAGAITKPAAIDDVWQSLIASQHQQAPAVPAGAESAADGAGVGIGAAAAATGAETSAAAQDEAGLARCRAAVALVPGQTPAPAGGLLRVLRGSAAVRSPAAGGPHAATTISAAGEADRAEGLATGATTGDAAAGSGAATIDGERGSGGDGGGGRRVPSRLQPWACGACTFENLAGAKKCRMCRTLKPPTASKGGSGPAGAASPSQPYGGDESSGAAAEPTSGKRPVAVAPAAAVPTGAAGTARANNAAGGGEAAWPEAKRKKTAAMAGGAKVGAGAEAGAAARRASAPSRAALPSALAEAANGRPGGQDGVAAGKENKLPDKEGNEAARADKTTAGAGAGAENGSGKRRRASAPAASGRPGAAAPVTTATDTATAAVALTSGVLTAAVGKAAATTMTAGPAGAGGAGGVLADTAADRRRKSVPVTSLARGAGAAGGAGCMVTPRPPLPSAAGPAGGRKSGATAGVAGAAAVGVSSRKKPRVSPPAAARDAGTASPSGDAAGGTGDCTQQQATQTTHRGGGCGSAAAGGRWSVPCPGWVLLGSGLEEGPGGKGMVRKLAAAAGAKVVDAVGPTVTHVLCGTDGSRRARRTFKYLMGVANGCWVLDVGWAAACLSAGAPVPEGDWQVVGDQGGGACGAPEARRRRLLRHQSEQDEEAVRSAVPDGTAPSSATTSTAASCEPLLHHARVYLQVSAAAREEVSALVRALGATLLSKLPVAPLTSASSSAPPPSTGGPQVAPADAEGAMAADARSPAATLPDPLILVDPDAAATAARGGGGAAARQLSALSSLAAALAGVPLVSYRWLHDSAGSYSLMPLAGYVVSAQRQ